ncbi:SIR2 family protein [Leifsonia sp. NPDC058194]|uniref:SIR2 family protein n=1 Tax=Leifsonia sp. NPDC058194 TaxID=3346374 RepID=UPI0036DC8F0A
MPSFDPQVSLATALQSQPGVYALLIGSGVSTGVGIPTGWGVVEALVRKMAVASGHSVGDDFDASIWWETHGDGELGYSSLLAGLGSTRASRRALLAEFFEPTEDDREYERKIPGEAHKAIASLVRKGIVRVIVTTNFDRLIERALEAEGVSPQIVQSDAQVSGMEPMQHMACTIIKLHGDYASLDQRNTIDELASYPKATARLLKRVLDEYGLVICGWSGEWDTALVAAIEASANRRYPLYWVARSELGVVAKRLTARSGAHRIPGQLADEFFPDLLSRVEAVETMSATPDSVNLAISRLKKSLPDPTRHIEVRDLFDVELTRLSVFVKELSSSAQPTEWSELEAGLAQLRSRSATLIRLFTTAILLDRDRQHTDLLVDVQKRAMAVRRAEQINSWWNTYTHYPALLLMRAGTMAALLAGHEDVARRIMQDATWSHPFNGEGKPQPAWAVLNPWAVTGHDQLNELPRMGGTKWFYPASRIVREDLEEFIRALSGDLDYQTLHNQAEFRAALAYQFGRTSGYRGRLFGGEFIGEQMWTWGEPQVPIIGADFMENGDRVAWGESSSNRVWFEEQIAALYSELRPLTRYF